MHSTWEPIIGPALAKVHDLGEDYLPPKEYVLRAFALPQPDVRVLIVGQDPYPTPGDAMGLAFSTAPGVKLPRSLHNIFRELHDDVGVVPPSDGDLSPWATRGVLLLNRVLTVRPGEPGSHRRRGWEQVTESAIRSLNRAPMVAILWGNDARSCARFVPDVPVICSPHPSPLSASKGFFGSRPFSRANAALVDQGAAPIDWRL